MPDVRAKLIAKGGLQLPTGAAAGKVATSDAAGNVSWADPASGGGGGTASDKVFSAYIGTAHGVTNTATKLQFNGERFDPQGWFNVSAYRFQPTIAGYYRIDGGFKFSQTVGTTTNFANVSCRLYKNNAFYRVLGQQRGGEQQEAYPSGSCIVHLNGTTDYVELFGIQTWSTSGIVTQAGMEWSHFEGELIS